VCAALLEPGPRLPAEPRARAVAAAFLARTEPGFASSLVALVVDRVLLVLKSKGRSLDEDQDRDAKAQATAVLAFILAAVNNSPPDPHWISCVVECFESVDRIMHTDIVANESSACAVYRVLLFFCFLNFQ
jgi:hypothetical protein